MAPQSTPADSAISPVERLARACALVGDIDLSSTDAVTLGRVTAELRRLEARCAGVGVDIARRATALGGDADAVLLGDGRVSGRHARKQANRARVADQMPEIADRLRAGEVSGEHLDAIANASAGLTDDETHRFAQLDGEVADAAARLPVDTFRRHLHKMADQCRGDHGEARLRQQRERSELKLWDGPDGMGHAHLIADPERFALLRTAIETETARLAAAARETGEPVTLGPGLQFDALMELLAGRSGGPGRPSITVVADHQTVTSGPHDGTVCETSSGVPLPVTVVERYLCDSLVRVITLDHKGLPLDVGRRHRTATPAQWAAIKALWRTCAWHRCERPVDWCQAHHIHEWDNGGPTNLANLVPLCSRHHHNVHEGRWRLRARADHTIEIHRPHTATVTAEHESAAQAATLFQTTARSHREQQRPPNQTSHWATVTPNRRRRDRPGLATSGSQGT